jgi:hypothetical protein
MSATIQIFTLSMQVRVRTAAPVVFGMQQADNSQLIQHKILRAVLAQGQVAASWASKSVTAPEVVRHQGICAVFAALFLGTGTEIECGCSLYSAPDNDIPLNRLNNELGTPTHTTNP